MAGCLLGYSNDLCALELLSISLLSSSLIFAASTECQRKGARVAYYICVASSLDALSNNCISQAARHLGIEVHALLFRSALMKVPASFLSPYSA